MKGKTRKMKLKGMEIWLNEGIHGDHYNYFFTDKNGNILMNIETGGFSGTQVLLMTESLKAIGFEVKYIEK